MREQILTGRPFWLVMKTSIPAILGQLAVGLYSFFDMFFVGKMIGIEALTAVSTASPFIMLNNAIAVLGGCGAAVVISGALGRDDKQEVSATFKNMLAIIVGLTIVLLVFVEGSADDLIRLSGANGRVADLGATYLRIVFAGSFFVNLSQSINMVVRSTGRMGHAMLITSGGAVLNIILDPVLISCLPWNGVYSVALATVISQLAQFLMTVYYMYQYEDECLHIKDFGHSKISKMISTKILSIGLSGMLMQLLMFLRAVFLYRSVSAHGTDSDLAVMGAAQRVLDLVFVVVWGISQAVNPLVGINYGAGKYGRVKKLLSCFWIWSTASCIVTEIIIVVFSEHILALFIEDRNLCIYGAPLLRTMYAGYFTYGIVMILITYLQIRGKALKALAYVALWQVGLLIPCSFFLPSIVNIPNIKWICVPIADIFSAVILFRKKT